MPLLKNGELVEDTWLRLDDETPLPGGLDIIVSFARLKNDLPKIRAHDGLIGVDYPNDLQVGDIAPYLGDLDLIVLTFPSFADGRSYSLARQIRAQLKFPGELRAAGNVLPDQLAFMRQCGFDVFEAAVRVGLNVWLKAATSMSLTYQRGYVPERGYAPAEVFRNRTRVET